MSYLEHIESALSVRFCNPELLVKASRSHEGRIQEICSVGGTDEDDADVGREAIHLCQQLIQGLLTLLIGLLLCSHKDISPCLSCRENFSATANAHFCTEISMANT